MSACTLLYVNKRGTCDGEVLIGSKKIINNNISKRRITGDIKTASASGSILTIGGGGGSDGDGGSRDSNRRSQRLTVLLVAIALFNDTLESTMLLPIIHTLVTSPPPLVVTTNTEVALGIFFASKDKCHKKCRKHWLTNRTSRYVISYLFNFISNHSRSRRSSSTLSVVL